MAAPGLTRVPVNLGNPTEFTVRELAEMVIDLTGSRSKIIFKPLPVDDPTQRRPDISKARQLLDWQPTVPLKDGLARTISYFEAKLNGVNAMPVAVMRAAPSPVQHVAGIA